MDNLYLWIDLFTLLGPLMLSFDTKVAFWKKWKALVPSIGIMMLVFIPWDIAFTINGIWGFNPDYLCGIELFHLPIEEWLFFIVVPYATVFIYECCVAYFNDLLERLAKPFLIGIVVLLMFFGLVFFDRWYTVVNFIGASLVLSVAILMRQKNLGYLLLSFLIALVPFLVVNGILTGTLLTAPIVWYNDYENMGIRMGTIPIEDAFYFLFFFVLVLIPYERFKARFLIQGNS